MTILNTTFIIQREAAREVLQWIRSAYIESSRKGACTTPWHYLTKILGAHDPDTENYALHIFFPDLEAARRWDRGVAESLRRIMRERWGEKVLTFQTYLEIVE